MEPFIIWDLENDPNGNVQHILEHDISMDDVEDVLLNPHNAVAVSRTSGYPCTFGDTSTGRHIIVVWEHAIDEPLAIRPITAYEVPEGEMR